MGKITLREFFQVQLREAPDDMGLRAFSKDVRDASSAVNRAEDDIHDVEDVDPRTTSKVVGTLDGVEQDLQGVLSAVGQPNTKRLSIWDRLRGRVGGDHGQFEPAKQDWGGKFGKKIKPAPDPATDRDRGRLARMIGVGRGLA